MSSALTKLKRKYRAAIKNTARDFMLDFKRYYNEAIDAFYNDYEPLKYKRTYMTYAASSLNKGYINPATEGESFLAEITVSPENIPGEPYMNRVTPFGGITGEESKKEIIFPRTFVKGIHGINRNDNLTRVRRNRYRKKRYVPKNMVPSPEKVFNKEYASNYGSKIKRENKINEYMGKHFKEEYITEYLRSIL